MISVLIADGSPAGRAFLEQVLAADPGIKVIGVVGDGEEALEFLRRKRADVVVMSSGMPGMKAFEAVRQIMETVPLPVVVVSGASADEQHETFAAFDAGALAVVSRPPAPEDVGFDAAARELRETVKAMAEVRVVRRWPKERQARGETEAVPPPVSPDGVRIVGIGASTGAPAAVKTILSGIPRNFPFPILLVQHMSRGFLQGFAEWLQSVTKVPVALGVDGEKAKAGRVYLAPEGSQMGVRGDGRIVLTITGTDKKGISPSVSWLFRALANSYGPAAMGILLTGMGADGAGALKLLKERGGIAVVQSAATCIVNGMPEEAMKINAATHVLSPEGIGQFLARLSRKRD